MNENRFCINWNSYLSTFSKGFSCLQQNEEFVDMTLAADGHLVKVHQNIVALASPYLKTLLQSAPCRHPVIFLNNISREILGYILEYIYSGEVKIPANKMDVFIGACKSLHINGIDTTDANLNQSTPAKAPDPLTESIDKPTEKFAAHITINTNADDYNLELVPNNNDANNTDKEMPLTSTIEPNNMDMDFDIGIGQKIDGTTWCQSNVDINSIHDFVILKPKETSANANNVDTKETKNPIKIQSDIIIKAIGNAATTITDWQTDRITSQDHNTSNTENLLNFVTNTNSTENPINITLDADWFSKADQKCLSSELNTNLTTSTFNIQNCSVMPIQISSNFGTNSNITTKSLKTDIMTNRLNNQNCPIIPIQTNSAVEINTNIMTNRFNTDCPIQTSSNIELNTNPINISLNTDDWQFKPSQSTSEIALKNRIENPANLSSNNAYGLRNSREKIKITLDKLDKKTVLKNMKKISSAMKVAKSREKKFVKITRTEGPKLTLDNFPRYTISKRGSLQIIIKDFLYNSHHHSSCGRKRRWRCIEYKKLHCPAYVDTDDDAVIAISADHVHADHNNLIKKKMKSEIVFSSLSNALETITGIINNDEERQHLRN